MPGLIAVLFSNQLHGFPDSDYSDFLWKIIFNIYIAIADAEEMSPKIMHYLDIRAAKHQGCNWWGWKSNFFPGRVKFFQGGHILKYFTCKM